MCDLLRPRLAPPARDFDARALHVADCGGRASREPVAFDTLSASAKALCVRIELDVGLFEHGAQILAELTDGAPPITVVDLEDREPGLEHERVRVHPVVGVGVLLDVGASPAQFERPSWLLWGRQAVRKVALEVSYPTDRSLRDRSPGVATGLRVAESWCEFPFRREHFADLEGLSTVAERSSDNSYLVGPECLSRPGDGFPWPVLRSMLMKIQKRWLISAAVVVLGGCRGSGRGRPDAPQPPGAAAHPAGAKSEGSGAATGLGPLSGILPRDKLTVESAIEINLSKEYARLPIYPGDAPNPKTGQIERVWYLLLDASDKGLADDLGRQLRAQAREHGRRLPGMRADRDRGKPEPGKQPLRAGGDPFPGRTRLQPRTDSRTRTDGFPAKRFKPGAEAPPGDTYSPFIRIAGSDVVYNAPIIATGEGPFDVTKHRNTGDRVLAVHIGTEGHAPSGQFGESWADLLFVKGFDTGQPIVYLSTDAGQPLTAVLERSTYVPALNNASFNGGDDFLGSARERLFGFINGQTAQTTRRRRASSTSRSTVTSAKTPRRKTRADQGLRFGGDLLNVFGDFPTLASPRHADAYSPLWDAQLGLWTEKAIKLGIDKRQVDENTVLNLAANSPTW